MTSMKAITAFLNQKRIAVVGVSHNPTDFSRAMYREFVERGYDAVPVNPTAESIAGQRCFARVQEITPPVDGVLLMTSPATTDIVVRDCAEAGVKHVWMYRGTGRGAVSSEAVKFCESQGMSVIPGECPFMFLPGGSWFHRMHGLVRKISGAYPQ
jgi:predicted CoA-binding protein